MTADEFRHLVLGMPGSAERSHMGHPDFRVGTRIFATLGYPDPAWAMVKLRPEQQQTLVASRPHVFRPAKGAWGQRGSTLVSLARLDDRTALDAVRMAWENASA